MSATLIRWTPNEEQTLARVQARLISSTGRSMSRGDVLRELLRRADADPCGFKSGTNGTKETNDGNA